MDMPSRGWGFLFFLAEGICLAQIGTPGQQYPPGSYPPGQYPPGQGPGMGGGGMGIPGISLPRRKKKTTDKPAGNETKEPKVDANAKTVTGSLDSLDEKLLKMTADDRRTIEVHVTASTKYLDKGKPMKSDDLEIGDHIEVLANSDDQGVFTAVSISRVPEAAAGGEKTESKAEGKPERRRVAKAEEPPAEKEDPAEPPPTVVRPPDPKPDADDPGPPTLMRGGGGPRKRPAASSWPIETASAGTGAASTRRPTPPVADAEAEPERPAIPKGADPVLYEARERAEEFSTGLPNYTCQQFTTRYQSESNPPRWSAIDVVGADVVLENGKESYRNLTINNRKVNKKIEDTGYSWSTGEFNTATIDVLYSYAGSNFKKLRTETIAHRQADVYEYVVPQPRSHWQIIAPGQSYLPSYGGNIWIDKETKRVLRLEKASKKMPQDFPFDTVESTVDYDFVRINSNMYLLPVHAEILSCVRGTANCSRNVIDFRNYKKFGSESTIKVDGVQN